MSIRTVLAIGIGAYLVGIALFGHANDASAAYRRVHSSQCHTGSGTGVSNDSTLYVGSEDFPIWCPAPSDSELPHFSTVWLNVHGYSPSATGTFSEACAKAYNNSSISCGTAKYWAVGFGGVYGVDVTSWSDAGAMPFVYSWLSAGSELYGFFMST